LMSSCRSHAHRQAAKLDLIVDECMFRHSRRNLFHLLRSANFRNASPSCNVMNNSHSSDPSLFSF
jgi:hypothetical protein